MRGVRRSFVIVTAASVGTASAANPPRPLPSAVPDPPVEAPTRAEAPTILRKHRLACFVYFPSGGSLVAPCPESVVKDPLGVMIERLPNGACQKVILRPPSKAPVACPPELGRTYEAGVLDAESSAFLGSGPRAWIAPKPARLTMDEAVAPADACTYGRGSRCPFAVLAVLASLGPLRRRTIRGGGGGRSRR